MELKMSLSINELAVYITRQLNLFFPDRNICNESSLLFFIEKTIPRLSNCLSQFQRKYFFQDGYHYFNHLHSDIYSMFLYFLSNTIYRESGDTTIATKIYYLNKSLHGIDVYYEIGLPEVFYFNHCVGTVLGRAKYGNFFAVASGCTVGGRGGFWPEFGENVALYNSCCVIGKTITGSNVHITTHTFVRDHEIPNDTLVYGRSPNLIFKKSSRTVRQLWFEGRE